MTKRWPAIFAPLAIAAYPVLFLFAHNAGQTYGADLIRPLLATIGLAVVVLGALTLAFRDVAKGGILTAATFTLFFGYGHVVNAFRSATPAVAWSVLGTEVALLAVLAVWLARARADLGRVTRVLAAVAAVLVALPLATLAYGAVARRPVRAAQARAGETPAAASAPAGTALPDIYYIILDSYASERSLREFYAYDNAPLVEALRARGFYVAPDSKSNYGQTLLSLSSSLNMTHLDRMTEPYRETSDRTVLMDAVRNSAVLATLREHGYTFVNIGSGFSGTDPMPSADAQLAVPKGSLTEFEVLLVSTTPLAELPFFKSTTDPFLLRRFAVLHSFETLADMPDVASPKFVFAHIVSPHPPFVFDREGQMRERKGRFNQTKYTHDEYVDGYRGQVEFVNSRLVPAIDGILRRYDPARPPVIIVQGDHGPRSLRRRNNTSEAFYRERFSILNAYLVPHELDCGFYPSISPVNSFRALFNCLFGERMEMLPDESYYSTSGHPYAFKAVSDLARSDAAPPEPEEKADDDE